MHFSMLLILGLTPTWHQDTDETRRAIAIVQSVHGTIVIDEKAHGKPVRAVNL